MQESVDRVEVSLQPFRELTPAEAEALDDLGDLIKSAMGPECTVNIRIVDVIEPLPSGKHIYTISKVRSLNDAQTGTRYAGPYTVGVLLLAVDDMGGAEKMFKRLAAGFTTAGLSVDLVLVSADGPNLSGLPAAVRVVDLRCRRLLDSSGALHGTWTKPIPTRRWRRPMRTFWPYGVGKGRRRSPS